MRTKNGFSLIEVVIAITIIGVIGTITSTILTRSYRAGTDTDNLSRLKQNGDLAVNVMTEVIRNAEGVVCYGGADVNRRTELVMRTWGGQYIKFRFVDPVSASGVVTTNGYIVKQENLAAASYPNYCNVTLATPEVPITNNNSLSGVSVSEGEFTKLTDTASKDTILIEFNVNRTLKARSDSDAETVPIRTTIKVR